MAQISAEILATLNRLYHHEMGNHFKYATAQTWFAFRGLDGAESFCKKQSAGELTHAQKVYDYINQRNDQVAVLPATFEPFPITGSFSNIFKTLLGVEQETTRLWSEAYAQAMNVGDYMTAQWIMDADGLMKEQIEEENTLQTVVDRITSRGEDISAIHDIDVWLKSL